MSERIGMADGRCIQSFTSSRIAHDFLIGQRGLSYEDGHKARLAFQQMSPEALRLPLPDAACKSGACLGSPIVSDQGC